MSLNQINKTQIGRDNVDKISKGYDGYFSTGLVDKMFEEACGYRFKKSRLVGMSPEEVYDYVMDVVKKEHPGISPERMVFTKFATGVMVIVMSERQCEKTLTVLT